MIFRATWLTTLMISSLVVLSGCGDKPKKKAEQNLIQIKGDPRAFFKHTANNSVSTIQDNGLNSDAEWTLAISGFQAETTRPTSYADAKKSQDPRERRAKPAQKDEGIAGEGYRFHNNGDRTITLAAKASNTATFTFSLENSRLDLKSLNMRGRSFQAGNDFEIIHYSSSPENDAHSILVYDGRGRNKQLIAFTFRKIQGAPATIERSIKNFFYLFYDDEAKEYFKVGWRNDRPLEFQTCPSSLNSVNKMLDESLKKWNQVLRGRLELRRGAEDQCPPFSDVNTRTVQVVEEWIELHGQALALGQAMTSGHTHTGKLVDADIFIFLAEWDEYLAYIRENRKVDDAFIENGWLEGVPVRQVLQRTMTHEIGHTLGLGHQFDGTPSIMSYDDQATELSDYDRRAIRELYPINPDLPQPASEGSDDWVKRELERIRRESENRGRGSRFGWPYGG